MTEYSGRTTCQQHQNMGNPVIDWRKTPNAGPDCIEQVTLFEVQWSNCPIEVEEEVKKLWRDQELGNDRYVYHWSTDKDNEGYNERKYPIITEYLKSRGVVNCLLRWWW